MTEPMPRSNESDRVNELLRIYSEPNLSVAHLLCDQYAPDRLAYRIIDGDLNARDLTYGELRTESERFAAGLRTLGISEGDRVATLMGKSREYLISLIAIWRIGAVHVPLFTAFAPPAIASRLYGSNAKVVICDASQLAKLAAGDAFPSAPTWKVISTGESPSGVSLFQDLLIDEEFPPPAAKLGGNAPIIHIYTSGTTGAPKGVVVPTRALAAFRAYAEFGYDLRPDDVFWCAADPGWAYGLYFGVLSTFTTGVRSILLASGFSAELTLAVLERERVTNFTAAPTVYRSLRISGILPTSCPSLRCASSAGEPLTPEVNEWTRTALGLTVYDHYGQTEAGMLINNHHFPAIERPIKSGSMGQAMPGWHATILDFEEDREIGPNEVGRVAMQLTRSPLAWFNGYDGDPTKTQGKISADGRWYFTGDTGLVDDDGYFFFSSRDDDVIIMAGYRIGPFEVESAMATHPSVAECAVIAVPDPIRGEVIEAYVVLQGSIAGSPELERDIQQWVKTHYAAHAYPRKIHFTESLPKTPSGKIQRFVLKQQRHAELASAS